MSTYHDHPAALEAAPGGGSGPHASRSFEELRAQAREAGREAVHKAQALGEQGQELASESYQQRREQARIWQEKLQQHIRAKPLQSLAVAGGAGLLLGLLWRR